MKVAVNGKVVDIAVNESTPEIPVEYQIQELKQKLADTDYIACKIAEGVATKEEYADILAKRQLWRKQIDALNNILISGGR